MTVLLSQFRSRVAPLVPTCPDPIIDQAVLDASIDFCERSQIVRQMLDEMTTTAGQFEYELEPPSQMQVCSLLRVWVDGREIVAAPEDVAPAFSYASVTGQTAATSTPQRFIETQPGYVGFDPVPDGAHIITARAALTPTRSALSVDDVIYNNWVEVVAAGALQRLYGMPGSWFDAKLSAAYGSVFVTGCNRAMLEASRGRNRADMRVTPIWI